MTRPDATEPNDSEVAWLVARARGEEAPAPATAASYERLEGLLAELPQAEPSAGFQARVLAQFDAEERVRSRRRWLGLGLAAAALVLVVLAVELLGAPHASSQPLLALKLETTRAGVHRASAEIAAVGDTLKVRGESRGPAGFELWVYRPDGTLALRCPSAEGCHDGGDADVRWLQGEVVLDAPGSYRALLVSGKNVPAPGKGLDADADAATRAGAEVVTAVPVRAQ